MYLCREPRAVFSVAVTGGAAELVPYLLTVPGASSAFMDARVPYSRSSLLRILPPGADGAVTAATAAVMAEQSRIRAISLFLQDTRDLGALRGVRFLGLSCTAALRSTDPKKGEHRVHVACASGAAGSRTVTHSLVMAKGERSRQQEDSLCSLLALDALLTGASTDSEDGSAAAGTCEWTYSGLKLTEGETVGTSLSSVPLPGEPPRANSAESAAAINPGVSNARAAAAALKAVFEKRATHALFVLRPGAQAEAQAEEQAEAETRRGSLLECLGPAELPAGSVVYPGSFNPLHRAHVGLVQAALRCIVASTVGADNTPTLTPVVFELAAINADKPALETAEVLARVWALLSSPLLLQVLGGNVCVCVTAQPLFVQKTATFRRCRFVLGADTLQRLLMPKYYGNGAGGLANPGLGPEQRLQSQTLSLVAALAEMRANGATFLVGGRAAAPPASASTPATAIDGDISNDNSSSGSGSGSGNFLSCGALLGSPTLATLPGPLRALFTEVPEDSFRIDLSSTQIRQQQQKEQEEQQEPKKEERQQKI